MNYASKQNLKVINDTYPCLELENLKFDNIFIFHVIEHVANPIELLVNIKRNLKQNGKLFIELPLLDKVLDKKEKNCQRSIFRNLIFMTSTQQILNSY